MAQYTQNATYANVTFDFSDKIVVVTGVSCYLMNCDSGDRCHFTRILQG